MQQTAPDIWFPNLGIQINHISNVAFSLFGLDIYWYGVLIVTGLLTGYAVALHEAKRTGQDPNIYADLLLYAGGAGVLGTRIYYITFAPGLGIRDLFHFRDGGLAIYGAVILAPVAAILYCRYKKLETFKVLDTAAPGLLMGQIIGRWGNFINREAFGGFTEGLFAMRYRYEDITQRMPESLLDQAIWVDGVKYLQVHPTFLYESMLNLVVFAGLQLYKRHKAFQGEILFSYLTAYGTIRAFLEPLRVDSLMVGQMRTSFVVSLLLIAIGLTGIVYGRMKLPKVNA